MVNYYLKSICFPRSGGCGLIHLLCGGGQGWRGGDVRAVEEPGEQHEVGGVHEQRVVGDVVGQLAELSLAARDVAEVGDEAAGHHLQDLRTGDEDGHEFRHADSHRTHRVVRVHHRVGEVVHHHEPAGGRDVLRVAVPAFTNMGHIN